MNVAEQASMRAFQERVEENPAWLETTYQYHQQLLLGNEYPTAYVDVIFQKPRQSPVGFCEAFAFAIVHTKIRAGHCAIFQIPMGSEPAADRYIGRANEAFNEMPGPFSGKFWGGTQGADGYIQWSRPINGLVQYNASRQVGFVIVPPSQVPLEMGTSSPQKAYLATSESEAGLARWPYGHKRITVIVPIQHCITPESEHFDTLEPLVWGNFEALPNPYEDEWT